MLADEVLEVAGVKAHQRNDAAKRQNIIIDEMPSGWIGISTSTISDLVLSSEEARRLASQLIRLAKRVEARGFQKRGKEG